MLRLFANFVVISVLMLVAYKVGYNEGFDNGVVAVYAEWEDALGIK